MSPRTTATGPTGPRARATDPPGPDPRGRLLREPRTAATDSPGPHLQQRDPRAPTTGKDAFGRPEPREGPIGPRPRGRTLSGAPNRAKDPSGTCSHRQPESHRPSGRRPDGTGSRQRERRQRRASSEVRRFLPEGALGRPPSARPSERLNPRVRQTEEPTAQPPPGGKRVDGTGGPLGARWRAGRTGPKPLGAKARSGHASDADSTRFGGATKRLNSWPVLSGPSGPQGTARHSSERRREGIGTSLGSSPREYRAVCQWKRRQARNGLRSGAMP